LRIREGAASNDQYGYKKRPKTVYELPEESKNQSTEATAMEM